MIQYICDNEECTRRGLELKDIIFVSCTRLNPARTPIKKVKHFCEDCFNLYLKEILR